MIRLAPPVKYSSALHGALLDIRDWLQRVGVNLYCNVFLGCLPQV